MNDSAAPTEAPGFASAIPASTTPARTSRALFLAVLLLLSINLRPAIASIPPLLVLLQRELGLSSSELGVLAALPVLFMGLLAPVSVQAAHRWGERRTLACGLVILAIGTLARLEAPHEIVLFASAIAAGAGIAIVGTLIPGLVKEYMADYGTGMGVHSFGLVVGASVAAGVTVPVAHALGSWPDSLALWTLVAVVALLAWIGFANRYPSPTATSTVASKPPLIYNHSLGWLLASYFAFQSFTFYALLTWLPALYEHFGWSESRAGYLLAAFNLVPLPIAFLLPMVAGRSRFEFSWFGITLGVNVCSVTALILAPKLAPWVWVSFLGMATTGGFSLGLTLFGRKAATPRESALLSSMAFFVSYPIAAFGPLLVGVLHDLVGSYRAGLLLLLCVMIAQAAVVAAITRLAPLDLAADPATARG